MRISFGCPGGFHIEAGAWFDKRTILVLFGILEEHTKKCPYCTFHVDPLTNRPRA